MSSQSPVETSLETIECPDLDAAIDHYTKRLGYRLDMIVPADEPSAAVLTRRGEKIRLERSVPPAVAGGDFGAYDMTSLLATAGGTDTDGSWVAGRAGMQYRDLIPGRLGGEVIASHIRLTKGGPVADYVHYHKVRFQMIYCLKVNTLGAKAFINAVRPA